MYIRKSHDEWQLMANYGYGWSVELTEFNCEDAKRTLREYRENGNGSYYIKKVRVMNA